MTNNQPIYVNNQLQLVFQQFWTGFLKDWLQPVATSSVASCLKFEQKDWTELDFKTLVISYKALFWQGDFSSTSVRPSHGWHVCLCPAWWLYWISCPETVHGTSRWTIDTTQFLNAARPLTQPVDALSSELSLQTCLTGDGELTNEMGNSGMVIWTSPWSMKGHLLRQWQSMRTAQHELSIKHNFPNRVRYLL